MNKYKVIVEITTEFEYYLQTGSKQAAIEIAKEFAGYDLSDNPDIIRIEAKAEEFDGEVNE